MDCWAPTQLPTPAPRREAGRVKDCVMTFTDNLHPFATLIPKLPTIRNHPDQADIGSCSAAMANGQPGLARREICCEVSHDSTHNDGD